MAHLIGEPVPVRRTFELADDGTPSILPREFGGQLGPGEVPHLHATGDWPALLGSIPEGHRTIITLHDGTLVTGGCVTPLNCPKFQDGCVDPCPRNHPETHRGLLERRRLIARLDAILVSPSRWMARQAEQSLHIRPRIIPNGVPFPEKPLNPRTARRAFGVPLDARLVLFIAHGGMRAAIKSGDRWPDMFKALQARVPGLVGIAVGGDDKGEVDGLQLWPYLPKELLTSLMAAADLLFYPTLADNHPLIILEAMSQGLPAVSYATGGIPEQIEHGVTGLLAPTYDEIALVDTGVEILSNPSRLRDLGLRAFEMGRKRFDAGRMAADYRKLYQSIS